MKRYDCSYYIKITVENSFGHKYTKTLYGKITLTNQLKRISLRNINNGKPYIMSYTSICRLSTHEKSLNKYIDMPLHCFTVI